MNDSKVDITPFYQRAERHEPLSEFWQRAVDYAKADADPTELTLDEVLKKISNGDEARRFFEQARLRARFFAGVSGQDLWYNENTLSERTGDSIAKLLQDYYQAAFPIQNSQGQGGDPEALAHLRRLIGRIETLAASDRAFAQKIDRPDILALVSLAHPQMKPESRLNLHRFIRGELDSRFFHERFAREDVEGYRAFRDGRSKFKPAEKQGPLFASQVLVETAMEALLGEASDLEERAYYCPPFRKGMELFLAGTFSKIRKANERDPAWLAAQIKAISDRLQMTEGMLARSKDEESPEREKLEEAYRNLVPFTAYLKVTFLCRFGTQEMDRHLAPKAPPLLFESAQTLARADLTPIGLDNAFAKWRTLGRYEAEVAQALTALAALKRENLQGRALVAKLMQVYQQIVVVRLLIPWMATSTRELPGLTPLDFEVGFQRAEAKTGIPLQPAPRKVKPSWKDLEQEGSFAVLHIQDWPSESTRANAVAVMQTIEVDGNKVWNLIERNAPTIYAVRGITETVELNSVDFLGGLFTVLPWETPLGILLGAVAEVAKHRDFEHKKSEGFTRRDQTVTAIGINPQELALMIRTLDGFLYSIEVLRAYEEYRKKQPIAWEQSAEARAVRTKIELLQTQIDVIKASLLLDDYTEEELRVILLTGPEHLVDIIVRRHVQRNLEKAREASPPPGKTL